MAIKILVTGDIHLGKRSSALPYDERKASTRYTWDNLVDYAQHHDIDLVLLTGDIIDQDNKFYEAVGPLDKGFRLLMQLGIPVYMVSGNHDYDVLPQICSSNTYTHIHLLGGAGEWESQVFEKGGAKLRIMGISFTERYFKYKASGDNFPSLPDDNLPTLALVHGDTYSSTSRYNPLNVETLRNINGVDAWLLGHIHKPEVLCESYPLILYPGSPHALHSNEQGIHGPYILTVDAKNISYNQIALSPVHYKTLAIDVSTVTDEVGFRQVVINSLRKESSQIREEHQASYLVFDLEITGAYNNPAELSLWSDQISTYDTDDEQSTILVRTIRINVKPRLVIENLLSEPSYIGVLANAIKTLEEGSMNDFTGRLLNEWKTVYLRMVSTAVYTPLHFNTDDAYIDSIGRSYILKQCKELLSELNLRKNEDKIHKN